MYPLAATALSSPPCYNNAMDAKSKKSAPATHAYRISLLVDSWRIFCEFAVRYPPPPPPPNCPSLRPRGGGDGRRRGRPEMPTVLCLLYPPSSAFVIHLKHRRQHDISRDQFLWSTFKPRKPHATTERGVLYVARFCYVFPCELRGPAGQ